MKKTKFNLNITLKITNRQILTKIYFKYFNFMLTLPMIFLNISLASVIMFIVKSIKKLINSLSYSLLL